MSNSLIIKDHLEQNGFFYRIKGLFKKVEVVEGISPEYLNFVESLYDAMPKKMMRINTLKVYTSKERKYNSNCTRSLDIRTDGNLSFGKIPGVKSNIKYPILKFGKLYAWFTPDCIIVKETAFKNWAVLSYADIVTKYSGTIRVTSGDKYKDTPIVDYTWQYMNKKGGPDKRFKENKRIPVVEYGEIVFDIGEHNFSFASSDPSSASKILKILKTAKGAL